MIEPAYPPARAVAGRVSGQIAQQARAALDRGERNLAPESDVATIEAMIEAAFWASLRREEGHTSTISLALLPPDRGARVLLFDTAVPLAPDALSKLAPAVRMAGIHLGVWHTGSGLAVWGIARALPAMCLVVEVVAPGLLVVKYPHGISGKFINVAVLEGDQIKVVDENGAAVPDCPAVVTALLGFDAPGRWSGEVNVFVRLAVSMRQHGRGGALLVVPAGSDRWRRSIVQPLRYVIEPPFAEIERLMREPLEARRDPGWQDVLTEAVEAIAGLTAVDGATVLNDRYELLAFAAKIARREESSRVQEVMVTEPVEGSVPVKLHPTQLGGTRHLSAAQFVFDQRDASALVASQDGRFTIFQWSPCEDLVHAHRVEALLL